jgi:hypothetical protein
MTEDNGDIIYIFNPAGLKSEEYKKKYPELSTIPEFDDIRSLELIFIWYIANSTSWMYWNYPEIKTRIKKAIEQVYGNAPPLEKVDWLEGKFSPRMKQAIERMYKFKPDVRNKAKEMVDNVFNDYQEVLKMKITEFTDSKGEINTTAYVKSRVDILKQLPEIIKLQEMGFGVTMGSDVKKQDAIGQKVIENYHKQKRGL